MRQLLLVGPALALAAVTPTTAAEQHSLTLIRDSKPLAAIVIADDATRPAQLAAHELQHHLRLVTRATLPIVTDAATMPGIRILVGESSATRSLGLDNASFDHQEYLIRFLPETIVLMGRDEDDRGRVDYDYLTNANAVSTWPGLYDEQGTMYAAYDFLEAFCGVRWINPTDFGTFLRGTKTLTVTGAEVRRQPVMPFRGGGAAWDGARYQYGGGLWRKGTPEAADYMAAAYPRLTAIYTNERAFTAALRTQNRLFQHRMKAGGDQRQCNHSFYTLYERFWHTGHKNFEEHHPEYFAHGYGGEEPPQLCYSNPATVAQVVTDIRDYFDNGGFRKRWRTVGSLGYLWGKSFFALEPMDNSAFCRCDTCTPQFELERERPSQHSTYWFRFVNAVAREIKASHPDKAVSTLAYMTHEGLPTDLRVEDNVAVHFCISAQRNCATAPKHLKQQFARLQEWKDRQPHVPLYIWHYHCFPKEIANNGKFYCFPGFFARELKKQFDYYRSINVQGIFHCGFDGEVENYVSYKLMDDPSRDVEVLLKTYFSAYGSAGKPMADWYKLAESRYCDPALIPPAPSGEPYNGHQTVRIAWEHLGDAKTMSALGRSMDAAKKKGRGQGARLVDLWDKGVWRYMQTGRETFVERMKAPIPSVVATRVPSAGGDPTKVEWNKGGSLGSTWYLRGGDAASRRTFGGRVCHDGEHFYLELVEENVTEDQLEVSAQIFCFDCWEPLFARQRAQPFRQYAVGPTGMTVALSHGEVNWRQNVKMAETGFRAATDTGGSRWVTRMSWPLVSLVDQPVKPGETIYMNVLRTSNPALAQEPRYGIDTWVSYCTV
ncbi:MAG: DUF4838 domain-containing protein [Lentisphaerae bacterium]|nr:DUF4838 domain-containing protein [Lentisphaerota bacterium]